MRIVFAALLLAGCASVDGAMESARTPSSPEQLAANARCGQSATASGAEAERRRSGPGDCSQADQACTSAGYAAGTTAYARCRINAALHGTFDQCYFTGPASGRLGPQLSGAELYCSGRGR